jgi:hypothetical protein
VIDTVRRVITGHDEKGRSVIVGDQAVLPDNVDHEIVIWSTAQTPVDNAGDPRPPRAAHPLEPPPGGSVLRVVEFPPESALKDLSEEQRRDFMAEVFEKMGASHTRVDTSRSPGMHKTRTMDYIILLSGELTLLMEVGETTLKPFDVVINRGANHDWVNRGSAPARIAALLIDATAV